MRARPRLPKTPLAIILGVAFLLRLSWLLVHQPDPVSDFATYLRLGRALGELGQLGQGRPTLDRLPGYPAFLACLLQVNSHRLWLGFANVLLSVAQVGLVHRLTLRLLEQERPALLAASFCALNPTFVFSASILASEHLASLLVLTALLLTLLGVRLTGWQRALAVLGAGFSLGLGVLTRGDALFQLPVLLALLWVGTRDWKPRLVSWALASAALASAMLPWMWRNSQLGAGFTLSTTPGYNFYMGHNPTGYGWESKGREALHPLGDRERNRRGWELGFKHLREAGVVGLAESVARGSQRLLLGKPHYAVRFSTVKTPAPGRPVWKTPWVWLNTLYYYGLLLLSGLALWQARRLPKPALLATLGPIAMQWLATAVIFWAKPRYRYLIELFLCILAALAVQGWLVLRERQRPPESAGASESQ